MTRHLSDEAIRSLLAGRVPEERPDLARLAEALEHLHRAASPELSSSRLDALAATAALESAAVPPSGTAFVARRGTGLSRLIPRLVVRIAVGTTFLFAIATSAAALGILPDPIQRTFADVYTVVGIDLPRPEPMVEAGGGSSETTTTVVDTTTTTEVPGTTDGPVDTTIGRPPPPAVALALTTGSTVIDEPGGTVRFEVEITNTSSQQVTVTSLRHDGLGDLLAPGNERVTENSCAVADDIVISGWDTLTCSFSASINGRGGGRDYIGEMSVRVIDRYARKATGDASVRVAFIDVAPSVTITASPSVGALDEPGGSVTVDMSITNLSQERITVTSLVEPSFGDLLDPDNPLVTDNSCPRLAGNHAAGAAFGCSFSVEVLGHAVASRTFIPKVVVVDRQANPAAATTSFDISFADVLPSTSASLGASPMVVPESGGAVTFSVTITNDSIEPVTLTSLVAAVFGDLLDVNPVVTVSTCWTQIPLIEPSESWSCTYTVVMDPSSGSSGRYATVLATVADDEGNIVATPASVSLGVTPSGTTVTGAIFADTDGDGVRDGGEPGLPGIAVEVITSAVAPFRVTTDTSGSWSTPVPPGEVTATVVGITIPAGLALTGGAESQTVIAIAGAAVATSPIGYGDRPQTLGGALYGDFNGNGVRDPGEPAIPGVTVRLLDEHGGVVGTMATGAAGRYSFVGYPAARYSIVVDGMAFPAGLTPWSDPDGQPDNRTVVVAGEDTQLTGIDFGYRGLGTLDGSGAPPNATVGMVWYGFDRVPETGDEYRFTTVADGTGRFSFRYLPQGSFSAAVW